MSARSSQGGAGRASSEGRASYVAVAGSAADDDASSEPARRERRSIGRRVDDAAFDAALRDAPVAIALGLVAVLVALALLPVDVALATWAVVAAAPWAACGVMCGVRCWRARRASQRVFERLLLTGLALLALLPWLHPTLADSAPMGGVLVGVALATVTALCPLRAPALVAALLPLSIGVAHVVALGGGDLGGSDVWDTAATLALSMLLSAAALQLASSRHHRWHRDTRVAIERDDRLRTLERERDDALRADRDKTRFVANACHDLRQPVHAIGLFAATLDKRVRGSVDEPLLRNLMRSIDGLERSLATLLDISRLDAGRVEPNIKHFPLRDVFRRLHMHFAGQAEQAGLGLRFAPGGKSVTSDPQLLERIIANLIQNALKYTDTGGVAVVARTRAQRIDVEVWDTGVGMRASDLPRVFDEFCQVGRSERARAQGLGMGLAIVKRLAHLLGHRLSVASQPGRGTVFRIGIEQSRLADIHDVTAPADTLPMTVTEPRSVLIVDDEEPIREGLRGLLEEWGYVTRVAASARQAEDVAQDMAAAPDLIVSDLHLGDGPDGIAMIDAVRRRCGRDVPAILVTGDTSHEELRRATDSGHPVLCKPVQPRRLFNALRALAA